jgi:ribose transport system substrate-binding protein
LEVKKMTRSRLITAGVLVALSLIFVLPAFCQEEGSGLPMVPNRIDFNLDVAAVQARHFSIGFSQCVMDHPYRISMVEKAKAAAKKYGVTIYVTDGQGRAEKEVANIQTFIARKVNAIVLSSHGGIALDPAIKAANKANIPIISIDGGRPYPGQDYVCWMSTDDWLLGENAGTMMVMEIGQKGKVAMIEGTPGSTVQLGRRDGFLKAIKNYPGIQLVADQQANFLRLDSLNVVSNILQSHPDLNAIYCHNDEMAIGAIEAVKKAGKKPGTDILVYSAADQQKNSLAAVAAGELQDTQYYCDDGGYAVEAAIYSLMGGKLPKKMNLGTNFITRYNVSLFDPAY